MRKTRRTRIQLAVFAAISVFGIATMVFGYMRIPAVFFGVGRYTVTLQLPQAGGLYEGGNVTYRGVEVGRVQDVRLTNAGAEAVLRMNTGTDIPAGDLGAEVHSVSAVGEQYVELTPHSGKGPSLKDGDVIGADRTYIPPDINSLLAATNRGLNAIPRDDLKTVVDEAYVAVGGLGPELSRLVRGMADLSIGARKNLDSLVTLIDESKPILDSQIQSSDSIQAWAAHLATITSQLKTNDSSVQGLLRDGSPAVDETRKLLDRLQPTLPSVLANLVNVGEVAVTYRDNLEALLVLLPRGTEMMQGEGLANRNTGHLAGSLSFNLNVNLPPPCTTGFLPIQQQRAPSLEDYPERPEGNFYCRIPQDSTLTAVRGARNYPCETRPGKRAATVKLCESDEPYVPLNDGFNWKGDPNATFTGQSVPQYDPGEARRAPGEAPPASAPPGQPQPPPGPPPPIAAAEYDPATGSYVGPDGRVYSQSSLTGSADKEETWQQMLTPPTGN